MILFFDTETTGLPLNYDAPPSETASWPRLVELSWQLCDAEGNVIESATDIILPVGFTISASATLKHGISDEQARSEGIPLGQVLRKFYAALGRAEYYRTTINMLLEKPKVCTMQESTEFCALPKSFFTGGVFKGGQQYKWPKLEELHKKLFGEAFIGSHRAANDVAATARCYFEMRRQGIIGGLKYGGVAVYE